MTAPDAISPRIHPSAYVQSAQIGEGTSIWQFVVVLPKARIGHDCNVCAQVFIENDVVVGDRVTIKNGVQLWDGLRIEDDVFIGPNVTFTNDKFPRSKVWPVSFPQTTIQRGASIGGGGGNPARHHDWREGHGRGRISRHPLGSAGGDRRGQSRSYRRSCGSPA